MVSGLFMLCTFKYNKGISSNWRGIVCVRECVCVCCGVWCDCKVCIWIRWIFYGFVNREREFSFHHHLPSTHYSFYFSVMSSRVCVFRILEEIIRMKMIACATSAFATMKICAHTHVLLNATQKRFHSHEFCQNQENENNKCVVQNSIAVNYSAWNFQWFSSENNFVWSFACSTNWFAKFECV